MVLAESATISFDDFIDWLPERAAYRYELWDGKIVEMPKPRGKHSEIAGSIIAELIQSTIFPNLPLSIASFLS
jgi:Uma2 family endonuclease